uniref:Protein tyrosine phosphatase receptor type Na n=1 Tax=Takifugu rubripes TaxID=31033 RepID=H2UFW5_TAKRU
IFIPITWRATLLPKYSHFFSSFCHLFCPILDIKNRIYSNGLFGQCLSSKQDKVQYQVSVQVLKRMQEVLKQLMLQGLSWQDDITQYILSKELKRVPHTSRTSKSKQHPPHYQHSSNLGSSSSPGANYVDYMIPEPPQSPMNMQTASMDPYMYQDEVQQYPHGAGGTYARPSSRTQANQRELERDRQLLQEVLSLYLASSQPSYGHRGAAVMAPAGEHLQIRSERPVLDTDVLSCHYVLCCLQRMSGVLQRYGVDPRELSQDQLYKLALILQLLQAQEKTGTTSKKPATVLDPPDAPPAPSSTLISAPTKSSGSVPSASQPTHATEPGQSLKDLPLDGTGGKEEYGYIFTNQSLLTLYDGVKLLGLLADRIHLSTSSFINISVVGPAVTFRLRQNEHNVTAAEVAAKAVSEKHFLESETGLKIVQSGVGERTDARGLPQVIKVSESSGGTVIILVSMAVVGGVLVLAMAVACFRHYNQQLASGKLGLGPEGGAETHFDYQELCRQHMASKSSLSGVAGAGGRRGTDTSRVSSVSSQFSDGPQHSPSSTHSSTPSWSEEPAQSNMDISTGHMILAYMEDHLRNKDRLQKEWEALCSYQADPSSSIVAQNPNNIDKNRHAESLPYDHSRVKLKSDVNATKQDYINASFIFDHDPRQPAYIATQGPMAHTVADFWQMVWENGCTVIVMMTALVEDGEKQSERYWPDEGSSLYHIYEVNLVSEHIWCKDFLVRSFYLKNVQTQETRTLTQFHLLSWPANGIPTSTRPLLDFRRKVNKCYRGRSCPIIVHCSDGTSRTGTYILIDMVLNRMAKGVKEIDIAAALEHIRDQRPGLVRTKDQFEFALTAVAEEVNAILKALPQ